MRRHFLLYLRKSHETRHDAANQLPGDDHQWLT